MLRRAANASLPVSMLDVVEDATVSVALDGTVQNWSCGAERLYGYSALEITGQSLKCLVPLYEWPSMEAILAQASGGDLQYSEIIERLHKNGSKILLKVRRTLIRGEQGEIQGILEAAHSVASIDEGSPGSALLPLLIDQMPMVVWTTDQDLRITSNWGAGLPFSRIRSGELVGHSVYEFLNSSEEEASPVAEHCKALRGISSTFEYKRKNRVLEIRLKPLRLPSGEITGCIGIGLDITNRKKTEEEIFYQARHDTLTNLANYREFMDRLNREVHRAERSHRSFTLLLLDLNELKRINDFWGHLAGNRALKRLALVISEQCRSTDLAARYGGDEFSVILIDSDQGMAEQVARRVESRLSADLEEPNLSVSIGIGIYPDDGRAAAELIEAADRQLYQRKKELKNPIARAVGQILHKKNASR